MTFRRYVNRNDPSVHILAFRWNGNNHDEMVDFFYTQRPNADWAMSFSGTWNWYPSWVRDGVNKGGPAPTDWVVVAPWDDAETPLLYSDSNFHATWAYPTYPGDYTGYQTD